MEKIIKMEHLNKYVIVIKIKKEKLLLYNSINRCMIEIDSIEDNIDQTINSLDSANMSFLRSHFFLEETPIPVACITNSFFLNNQYSNDVLTLIIHTNYSCNLCCSYCYQSNIDKEKYMSEHTAKEICRFINFMQKKNNPKILDICFIGGEPLLYLDKIEKITKYINKLHAKWVKKLSIVTNGVLLTISTFEKLGQLGEFSFQVTLDGSKESNDRTRYFPDGCGSFDYIIKNIKAINEKYENNKVIINYNLDINNQDQVFNFFNYLKSEQITNRVIFSKVFDNKINNSKTVISNDSQIWFDSHRIAIDFGQRYDPFYRMSYMQCSYKKENAFIISPLGEVYKCISGIEDSDFYVGKINDINSHHFISKLSNFVEREITKQCSLCKYLFICGGGCLYKNDTKGFQCLKKEIESNDIPIIAYQYNVDH